MRIAACVDNGFGLSFMGRRQSKDSAVRVRLLELCGGRLRMSRYSAKQFEGNVYSGEDYITGAKDDDWCFVEDCSYLSCADEIQQIVLFRWNRDYPADVHFQFPGPWKLISIDDFPGTSHEKITQEVYRK